jgi:hypothetical protein
MTLDSLYDLAKSLPANLFVSENLPNCVMAYARLALKLANSNFENVLFDFFSRNYLFRLLIFERREFNETQIFALLPPAVGLFAYIST